MMIGRGLSSNLVAVSVSCWSCHSALPGEAAFCGGCGADVSNSRLQISRSTGTAPGVGAGPDGTWGLEGQAGGTNASTNAVPLSPVPVRSGSTIRSEAGGGSGPAELPPVLESDTPVLPTTGDDALDTNGVRQSSGSLTLELRCPSCLQNIGISPEHFSDQVECPRCHTRIRGADLVGLNQRVKVKPVAIEPTVSSLASADANARMPAASHGPPPHHHASATKSSRSEVLTLSETGVTPSRLLELAGRWDSSIRRASFHVLLAFAAITAVAQVASPLFGQGRAYLYAALSAFFLYGVVHVFVMCARYRDDDGGLRFGSALAQAWASVLTAVDAWREAGSEEATPNEKKRRYLRPVFAISLLLIVIGVPALELGWSLQWLNYVGWAGVALAILIHFGTRDAGPAVLAATSDATNLPTDPATASLHGQVFDLRDQTRREQVLASLPPGSPIGELLYGLATWKPRLAGGNKAHEHQYRDSMIRQLRRTLDGASRRTIKKEFQLPAEGGRACRRADTRFQCLVCAVAVGYVA